MTKLSSRLHTHLQRLDLQPLVGTELVELLRDAVHALTEFELISEAVLDDRSPLAGVRRLLDNQSTFAARETAMLEAYRRVTGEQPTLPMLIAAIERGARPPAPTVRVAHHVTPRAGLSDLARGIPTLLNDEGPLVKLLSRPDLPPEIRALAERAYFLGGSEVPLEVARMVENMRAAPAPRISVRLIDPLAGNRWQVVVDGEAIPGLVVDAVSEISAGSKAVSMYKLHLEAARLTREADDREAALTAKITRQMAEYSTPPESVPQVRWTKPEITQAEHDAVMSELLSQAREPKIGSIQSIAGDPELLGVLGLDPGGAGLRIVVDTDVDSARFGLLPRCALFWLERLIWQGACSLMLSPGGRGVIWMQLDPAGAAKIEPFRNRPQAFVRIEVHLFGDAKLVVATLSDPPPDAERPDGDGWVGFGIGAEPIRAETALVMSGRQAGRFNSLEPTDKLPDIAGVEVTVAPHAGGPNFGKSWAQQQAERMAGVPVKQATTVSVGVDANCPRLGKPET